jgi:cytochrome c
MEIIPASQEEQNTSSSGNSEATQPVSIHGKKNDDSLLKANEVSIHRGKDLYKKLCKKCHDAYSTGKITGPGMQGILKKDMLPSSQKPATARNILNQLNNPFDKMPSFHFLSEEEKLSIIAFLNTL